jgi:hypothetical protein
VDPVAAALVNKGLEHMKSAVAASAEGPHEHMVNFRDSLEADLSMAEWCSKIDPARVTDFVDALADVNGRVLVTGETAALMQNYAFRPFKPTQFFGIVLGLQGLVEKLRLAVEWRPHSLGRAYRPTLSMSPSGRVELSPLRQRTMSFSL